MLGVADYSQIELRILAHLSGDEVLCAAFRRGADIHGEIAAVVFGVPQGDVDSEMRNRVKFITYGLVYGMEAYGLASRMGTAPDEARALMEAYFEKLPTVSRVVEVASLVPSDQETKLPLLRQVHASLSGLPVRHAPIAPLPSSPSALLEALRTLGGPTGLAMRRAATRITPRRC